MITYETIRDAQEILIKEWGEAGKTVISACAQQTPFHGTFSSFLTYCVTCGGNWGGMILSGIKTLYPEVWDAIPDYMGKQSFACICFILNLLGIDTSK